VAPRAVLEGSSGGGAGAGGMRPGVSAAGPADSARVAREVVEMLRASAASWNAGDLDGFLDDYIRSPELTFSGSGGVTRGWEEVRERYLRTYWAPGARRDSLRFEELEVRPLGERHALALGRYVLYADGTGEVTGTGYFTLVLVRGDGGWRILHDHTSASSAPGAPEGEG